MAETGTRYSGTCLCGAVAYDIVGNAKRFFHCHCSRCRKATGTGHASNVIAEFESAVWTRGEDLIRGYRVPGAERFRTVFCGNCGSPLPRITPETGIAVIPAGSLDTVPELRPMARIFFESRTEWSCEGDDVPTWPGYPESA